jgi:hypothetical protein
MNKHLTGFIKAATCSGLDVENTIDLVKQAYSNLSPDDLAKIRLALQDEGQPAPYRDPYGPTGFAYNQAILAARDRSLNQDPSNQAALEAANKAVSGGAVGGISGNLLGKFLKGYKPSAPGSFSGRVKGKLPLALGVAGTVGGSLLNAIPAYNKKKQTVESLHKLNNPESMQHMIAAIQADKALLNS